MAFPALRFPVVPHPAWRLKYSQEGRGGDISEDISPSVISVTYHDKEEHAASEIEVKVEDSNHLWQGPWFPQRGDVLDLSIGYTGAVVPCGLFEIDEVFADGPPDVCTIKAISAYVTPALRTRFSRAYEGQTLRQIAATIALNHGLELVFDQVAPDVTLNRVTQKHETDLGFLRRIANAYGYGFTIRGQQLVFRSRLEAEAAPPIDTINRTNLMGFNFKTVTHQIYQAAEVSYFDPSLKALTTATATARRDASTGDTLSVPQRAETGQDATAKAEAALHGNNMAEVTGTLNGEGNTLWFAGFNVTVTGFGQWNGTYHIDRSRHSLRRGTTEGYLTSIEVRRVANA